jgi:hypothetical protein
MKTPTKESSKKEKLEIRSLLISIFSTIFILAGSFSIYYLSKGYKLNISEREITKIGVLTVESEPSLATLYVEEKSVGRTPRSRTLDTGTYNISLKKEGYREWKKEVDILEEKSTPVYPLLLLEELKKETLWESESILEKYWISENKEHFIYLQQDTNLTYSLWQYRVNTSLWSLNQNPIQILELETKEVELDISPNGQLAILTITEEEGEQYYLIELQKVTSFEDLQTLEIADLTEYEITWAKDNRHLILESSEDIISLDTIRNVRYLLTKKSDTEEYIWNTDKEGFFYILEKLNTEEDSTYTYSLKQLKLDGTNPTYTIEKAYFQKDESYVEHYRNNGDSYPEFKNSPQATQAMGQITQFDVNQSAEGVYINTNTSTYWYDITKDRYLMVSPYPTELIQFAPDSNKLLFANGDYLYVFTFDKEEGDHTEEIGSMKVDNLLKTEVSDIKWLSNSSYVYYTKDNYLHISEKDGENNQQMLDLENILLYSVKTSREHIITLEQGETFTINQYKIK